MPFGGASSDPQMLNKRGEMFNACKTWLKLGGALDDEETADDLSAAEYKVRVDGKIVMEPKEDIKRAFGPVSRQGRCAASDVRLSSGEAFRFPCCRRQAANVISEYDPWA